MTMSQPRRQPGWKDRKLLCAQPDDGLDPVENRARHRDSRQRLADTDFAEIFCALICDDVNGNETQPPLLNN